jgi:hypothetical protein
MTSNQYRYILPIAFLLLAVVMFYFFGSGLSKGKVSSQGIPIFRAQKPVAFWISIVGLFLVGAFCTGVFVFLISTR